MNKNQQPALTLFVIGLLGLGVLALHYRDFALVWQPVPVWVPAHAAVACATGVLMLALAIGLLIGIHSRIWRSRDYFLSTLPTRKTAIVPFLRLSSSAVKNPISDGFELGR